jgi:chitosanase
MPKQELSADVEQRLQAMLAAFRSLETTVRGLAQMTDGHAATVAEHAPRALATAEVAGALELTAAQRRICERVINVFETGTIQGKYGAISIYHDGPNDSRQITYGRSQTTEYGNLPELVAMYVDARGTFSESLRPYLGKVGQTPLVDDATFKNLLRRAGNEDPVMRSTQDVFFERRYFQPALRWSRDHGFTRALSFLVIYDSFIHSGSILDFLRNRFAESPPAQGGSETTWISQYIRVRHDWLSNHSSADLRLSSYRTRDLSREVANGNWDLAILPIMANGVAVYDAVGVSTAAVHMAAPAAYGTPVFGDGAAALADGEDWCECEPPALAVASAGALAAAVTPAEMADRILNHPNIRLATAHVSGVNDHATARQNIIDTAAGQPARRSSYNNAPGGTVRLDPMMLSGLLTLANTYSFHVSELCGGSHSPTSRHYKGVTADINIINDQHVSANHPDQAAFRSRCRDLGATEVLGPGNANHSTHIHAAWPVPH